MKQTLIVILICFCHTALAYPYRIYTVPEGALVKNILTNEYLGKTPVVVDVSNTEAGSTFGISLFRHKDFYSNAFSRK